MGVSSVVEVVAHLQASEASFGALCVELSVRAVVSRCAAAVVRELLGIA
ncbi:hypothetical protein [Microbacterium testaceum]|nr:hypothetical protein [Microbacterium testaceum]